MHRTICTIFPAIALLAACGSGGTNGRPFETAPPDAVTDVKAQWELHQGDASIVVAWSDLPSNVHAVVVERQLEGNEFTTVATDLPPESTSFADHDADLNAVYTYRVTARNNAGDSPGIETDPVTSPLPTCIGDLLNLQTTSGPTTLRFEWTHFCAQVKGFEVTLKVLETQEQVDVKTVLDPANSCEFTDLTPATKYSVYFSAFNDFGSFEIELGFSGQTTSGTEFQG